MENKSIENLKSSKLEEDGLSESILDEISVNSVPLMPFQKKYRFSGAHDKSSPVIETINEDKLSLAEAEALTYFKERLKRVSKIPLNK